MRKILKFLLSPIHNNQKALKLKTRRRRLNTFWKMDNLPDIVDQKDLKKGDVIFCSSSIKEKQSDIIQYTTEGVYVHCGLYVGNGQVIDVVTEGIRKIELFQFVNNYDYVVITRCRGLNKERSKKVLFYAYDMLEKGIKYNYLQAGLVPLVEYINIKKFYQREPWLNEGNLPKNLSSKKRLFCSQFIINCFIYGGYIRNELDYMKSYKWSPNSLAEENIFTFIGYMVGNNGGLEKVHKSDHF